MAEEMDALYSNGTWELVVVPLGKSPFGCRWVYTVKVGPDGQVDRLKVRLVVKGYTQQYGSDYYDIFFSGGQDCLYSLAYVYGCYPLMTPFSVRYQECLPSW